MCSRTDTIPRKGSTEMIRWCRGNAAHALSLYREKRKGTDSKSDFERAFFYGRYQAFRSVISKLEGDYGIYTPVFQQRILARIKRKYAKEAACFQPPAVIYPSLLTSTKGAA